MILHQNCCWSNQRNGCSSRHDHLNICQVQISDDKTVQIVAGAPNAAVGLKTIVALPGAMMPNGSLIFPGALRGEKELVRCAHLVNWHFQMPHKNVESSNLMTQPLSAKPLIQKTSGAVRKGNELENCLLFDRNYQLSLSFFE